MTAAHCPQSLELSPEQMADMSDEERRAVLVWRLCCGERFTTLQVAEMLHIRYKSAHRYLCRVSRVLAIYYDDPEDGGGPRWQRV